jgi:DNA mismatch repair ATPase MutL
VSFQVGKYALFKSDVSFTCKKHGETRLDLQTHGRGGAADAVRAVYGTATARHLIPLQVRSPGLGLRLGMRLRLQVGPDGCTQLRRHVSKQRGHATAHR